MRKMIPKFPLNPTLLVVAPFLIPFKLLEGVNDGRGSAEVSYGPFNHPSRGPYGLTRDMLTASRRSDRSSDIYTVSTAAIGETLSLPFYWAGRGVGSLYRKVRPR